MPRPRPPYTTIEIDEVRGIVCKRRSSGYPVAAGKRGLSRMKDQDHHLDPSQVDVAAQWPSCTSWGIDGADRSCFASDNRIVSLYGSRAMRRCGTATQPYDHMNELAVSHLPTERLR